jgi:hypothetical protein
MRSRQKNLKDNIRIDLTNFLLSWDYKEAFRKNAINFVLFANKDLLESHLIRFISTQKERIETRDISEGTLRNYI